MPERGKAIGQEKGQGKVLIFVVGGFACIAPNIIQKAAILVAGGTIDNVGGILLGAVFYIALAGFCVAYVLDAKDIKDAFYKGVAVPALILALANGTTTGRDAQIPLIPTTPTGNSSLLTPDETGWSLTGLLGPRAALAQPPHRPKGRMAFSVRPDSVGHINVTIKSPGGKVLAKAGSETARFELMYFTGEYVVAFETATLYGERKVTVVQNQTTSVDVNLGPKSGQMKFFEGVRSLMRR